MWLPEGLENTPFNQTYFRLEQDFSMLTGLQENARVSQSKMCINEFRFSK